MKAFPGKHSQNYHDKRLQLQRNPTAGRTRVESTRIRRQCERLRDNLAYIMDLTRRQNMP